MTFRIFFLLVLLFPKLTHLGAQNYSDSVAVKCEASVNNSSIEINWDNSIVGSQYEIYRKIYGSANWGNALSVVSSSSNSYTDNTVVPGNRYEYKIVRRGNFEGNGYILTGIKTEIAFNKGKIILLVDDAFVPTLNPQIDELISDIESDGWFVYRQDVNRLTTPSTVKTTIQTIYNTDPNEFKCIFLLGHIPVPYSGNINPDGHADHKGAWPTDMYYADINGTWNDVNINTTVATDSRNHNIPGDGKYDRNTLPSDTELEIARVDFYNLPLFPGTESDLMENYLNKLHAFKTYGYIPANSMLVEDNFQSMPEGFSGMALTNFSAINGMNGVSYGDYSSMTTQDYLWSYGTGAGTYTSAQGIVSSTDFSSNDYNCTFTSLFGSYFGDWDTQNNLLRCALASGKILTSSWSGRPFIQYFPMALGENIGTCSKLSQNNSGEYFLSTLNNFDRWIHISQMGDPTLRLHYLPLPQNLTAVSNTDGSVNLSWSAASNILGYYIFRRNINDETWTKITSNYINTTSYTDLSLTNAGNYEYMVRSVDSTETGSGIYLNMSLGVKATVNSTAGINEFSSEIKVYPNPADEYITLISDTFQTIEIFNAIGELIYTGNITIGENKIIIEDWENGFYFIRLKNKTIKFIKSSEK